jgi:hypothetical protein
MPVVYVFFWRNVICSIQYFFFEIMVWKDFWKSTWILVINFKFKKEYKQEKILVHMMLCWKNLKKWNLITSIKRKRINFTSSIPLLIDFWRYPKLSWSVLAVDIKIWPNCIDAILIPFKVANQINDLAFQNFTEIFAFGFFANWFFEWENVIVSNYSAHSQKLSLIWYSLLLLLTILTNLTLFLLHHDY